MQIQTGDTRDEHVGMRDPPPPGPSSIMRALSTRDLLLKMAGFTKPLGKEGGKDGGDGLLMGSPASL